MRRLEEGIPSEYGYTAGAFAAQQKRISELEAQGVPIVSDEMVSRFLAWPLPKGFYPDCGISFDGRKDDEWNKNKTWPTGTNLLTAEQARAMLRHVIGIGQIEEAKQ